MAPSMTSLVRDTLVDTVEEGLATLSGQNLSAQLGEPLPLPQFVTGLATAPCALPRQALGLLSQLVVPPGSWAVVHLPGGEAQVYSGGSYWLWGLPGAAVVQWVDARRQQVPVGPIEGWSLDKWRVRLWLIVDIAVAKPTLVAAHREPLVALAVAARTAALSYMEQHSHAELTGCADGQGGLDAPAAAVAGRLRADLALAGMEIVSVRVIERQGDERQIEATTAATVAAARIDEEQRVDAARHRARLQELESQATIDEREHGLRLATVAAQARERLLAQQSEVQQAALGARLQIVMAQIRAQVAEIAHDEQLWQAEQARLQGEWERAQRELLSAHGTDQQLLLLGAEQSMASNEAELAVALQERQSSLVIELAAVQQRIAEQRGLQAQAIAERRAAHERSLLELHLQHEAMVAEQVQKLDLIHTS
jgi:hypothetical protein